MKQDPRRDLPITVALCHVTFVAGAHRAARPPPTWCLRSFVRLIPPSSERLGSLVPVTHLPNLSNLLNSAQKCEFSRIFLEIRQGRSVDSSHLAATTARRSKDESKSRGCRRKLPAQFRRVLGRVLSVRGRPGGVGSRRETFKTLFLESGCMWGGYYDCLPRSDSWAMASTSARGFSRMLQTNRSR